MQRKKVILIHVLFWLVLYIKGRVMALTSGGLVFKFSGLFRTSNGIGLSIGYLSITMFAFYGSYIVVKKILFQKKVFRAALYILLLLASLVIYRAVLEFWVFKPFFNFDNYAHTVAHPLWKYFIPNVILYYWDCIIYGLSVALFMHWQSMEKAKREKETLDKTMQLIFLQSQVNPHFLFNTINDIYALSLKKSDKTPEALLQLSGLLRYALYDNKEMMVPLNKELVYINDYLNLQRTGYENLFYVTFETEGNNDNWNIPPMLLLPFVENACKHGVTNDESNPVRIFLSVNDGQLIFTVANRIRVAQKDAEGGIGIENIRRRLELLYPAKHSLRIKEDNDTFIVQLQIEK
jgi:two-component system LytT family sensor kinase